MKRAKNEGHKGGQEEGKKVEREGGTVGGKIVHAGKVELLEPTGSLATMPFSG